MDTLCFEQDSDIILYSADASHWLISGIALGVDPVGFGPRGTWHGEGPSGFIPWFEM